MTKNKLSPLWTKGMDQERKVEFESLVRNNTLLLEQFDDILDYFERELYNQEHSEENYKDSSWAYLQAHRNGKRSAFAKLRKLTDHMRD